MRTRPIARVRQSFLHSTDAGEDRDTFVGRERKQKIWGAGATRMTTGKNHDAEHDTVYKRRMDNDQKPKAHHITHGNYKITPFAHPLTFMRTPASISAW